jgi:DNA topoisomerase III
MEFDFGEDAKKEEESGEAIDFSDQTTLGACPKCNSSVFEHGTNYICEKSVGPQTSCDFKTGKVILQQPITAEQLAKLLENGKTDLLDGFVSNKTRRKFKAFLSWNAKDGKVGFEFEPRAPRAAGKTAAKTAAKTASKTASKTAAKKAAGKTPGKAGAKATEG